MLKSSPKFSAKWLMAGTILAMLLTEHWPHPDAPHRSRISRQPAPRPARRSNNTASDATARLSRPAAWFSIPPRSIKFPVNAETWEKAIRQLRAKSMPPVPMPRPDAATYDRVASYLETRARPRGRRPTQSRRTAQPAPPDAHRISQRHPRPAGAGKSAEGDGLHAPAAGRQRLQRLRQHCRSAVRVSGHHGALSGRVHARSAAWPWAIRRCR